MTVEMQQISPKAKESANKCWELRQKESKFITLQPGKKRIFTYNYTLEF
ncbi:MAG: hypothetical protein K0S91_2673 [Nitrososphaeraceae archaeon]|jgi:hypothetical protein|nr:hypothetical protein [Nitrososphaeraceae archaeon]